MNTEQEYLDSINDIGLELTWDKILNNYFPNDYFKPETLGGLYELGLATENKIEKKAMGKYYTPDDVASVMAQFLLELPGDNICDLCCGTGNLIFAVLNELDKEIAISLLQNGHIYLYDIDKIALKICKAILINTYGEVAQKVNIINDNCLSETVTFPPNAKIISNPPYGKDATLINQNLYSCAKSTKELYVAFMEKIIQANLPAVIITSHSFLGGNTFKTLRNELTGGKIFAFDNVPGNIFKGKKFGIFNSNETNSTRAAITIIEPYKNSFLVAPFIRFRAEDRPYILNKAFLDNLLPDNEQTINNGEIFYRIEKGTEDIVNAWFACKQTLNELISSTPTQYKLDVPNTCRYFTTASIKSLNRTGKIVLYFKNENALYLAYAFINSSLCYYYHRICNGGITYPITLLKSMPIFGTVTEELKTFCNKMMKEEESYIVLKKNAGQYQENIKFPLNYRLILNSLLLKQINITKCNILSKIHSNSCLIENITEEE